MAGMPWWAAHEGAVGDFINAKIEQKNITDITWHVVQSPLKPSATAQGPFPTQAAAQARADSLNQTAAGSSLTQAATNAAKSAVGNGTGLTGVDEGVFRAAEVLLGITLIGIGLAHITGTSNAISKVARDGIIFA